MGSLRWMVHPPRTSIEDTGRSCEVKQKFVFCLDIRQAAFLAAFSDGIYWLTDRIEVRVEEQEACAKKGNFPIAVRCHFG